MSEYLDNGKQPDRGVARWTTTWRATLQSAWNRVAEAGRGRPAHRERHHAMCPPQVQPALKSLGGRCGGGFALIACFCKQPVGVDIGRASKVPAGPVRNSGRRGNPGRRFASEANAPSQIAYLQANAQVRCINRMSFRRLVRDLVECGHPECDCRFEAAAMEMLHEAAESLLVDHIVAAYSGSLHRNRATLEARDLDLARRMAGPVCGAVFGATRSCPIARARSRSPREHEETHNQHID
jgi:histone H3/H4